PLCATAQGIDSIDEHLSASFGPARMFADRTNWDLAENPLSEALAEHRKLAKPLFDLTASNPTQCGFDYDAERILQSLASPEALSYRPDPKGLELSRRVVATYYGEHDA